MAGSTGTALGSWSCSNCGCANPSFHWPQCGACGYMSFATEPSTSLFYRQESYDSSARAEIEAALPSIPSSSRETISSSPKLHSTPAVEGHSQTSRARTWQTWRHDVAHAADAYFRNPYHITAITMLLYLLTDSILLATDWFLIAIEQLEPPLDPGKTRLRWLSADGAAFFDDVEEISEGGVADLVEQIEMSSGIQVSISTYSQGTGSQQYYALRPDRWVRRGFEKVASAIGKAFNPPSSLPHYNTPDDTTSRTNTSQSASQSQVLHLMACIHRDQQRKIVRQDEIGDTTTDRGIIRLMRQQYISQRGRIKSTLSLRSVEGIFLVRFWLPIGGSVDVRSHNQCSEPCDCLPPLARVEPSATAEYKCSPVPPKVWPPIPPRYLKMLFCQPSSAHEDDTWVFNQLPKRTCGQLHGAPGQPAEGWGIYYQECWDRDLITLVIFLVFLLASLLFGILWSTYKYDVQGAFGVSAWMATLGGIMVVLLVPRF